MGSWYFSVPKCCTEHIKISNKHLTRHILYKPSFALIIISCLSHCRPYSVSHFHNLVGANVNFTNFYLPESFHFPLEIWAHLSFSVKNKDYFGEWLFHLSLTSGSNRKFVFIAIKQKHAIFLHLNSNLMKNSAFFSTMIDDF